MTAKPPSMNTSTDGPSDDDLRDFDLRPQKKKRIDFAKWDFSFEDDDLDIYKRNSDEELIIEPRQPMNEDIEREDSISDAALLQEREKYGANYIILERNMLGEYATAEEIEEYLESNLGEDRNVKSNEDTNEDMELIEVVEVITYYIHKSMVFNIK